MFETTMATILIGLLNYASCILENLPSYNPGYGWMGIVSCAAQLEQAFIATNPLSTPVKIEDSFAVHTVLPTASPSCTMPCGELTKSTAPTVFSMAPDLFTEHSPSNGSSRADIFIEPSPPHGSPTANVLLTAFDFISDVNPLMFSLVVVGPLLLWLVCNRLGLKARNTWLNYLGSVIFLLVGLNHFDLLSRTIGVNVYLALTYLVSLFALLVAHYVCSYLSTGVRHLFRYTIQEQRDRLNNEMTSRSNLESTVVRDRVEETAVAFVVLDIQRLLQLNEDMQAMIAATKSNLASLDDEESEKSLPLAREERCSNRELEGKAKKFVARWITAQYKYRKACTTASSSESQNTTLTNRLEQATTRSVMDQSTIAQLRSDKALLEEASTLKASSDEQLLKAKEKMRKENAELQKDKEHSQREYKQADDHKDSISHQLKSKKLDLESVSTKLKNSEIKATRLEGELNGLRAEKTKVVANEQRISKQLKDRDVTVERLSKELEAATNQSAKFAQLERDHKKLSVDSQQKIETLESTNAALTLDFKTAQTLIEKLEREAESITVTLLNTGADSTENYEACKKAEKELEGKNAALALVQKEKQEIATALEDTKSKLDQAASALERKISALGEAGSARKEAVAADKGARAGIWKLKQENAAAEKASKEQNFRLEQEISKLQAQMKTATADKSAVESELSKLRDESQAKAKKLEEDLLDREDKAQKAVFLSMDLIKRNRELTENPAVTQALIDGVIPPDSSQVSKPPPQSASCEQQSSPESNSQEPSPVEAGNAFPKQEQKTNRLQSNQSPSTPTSAPRRMQPQPQPDRSLATSIHASRNGFAQSKHAPKNDLSQSKHASRNICPLSVQAPQNAPPPPFARPPPTGPRVMRQEAPTPPPNTVQSLNGQASRPGPAANGRTTPAGPSRAPANQNGAGEPRPVNPAAPDFTLAGANPIPSQSNFVPRSGKRSDRGRYDRGPSTPKNKK
ncbi:MAG: hypothetical protein MMC33_007444 [Icmadophila ericetorum]|nr:hypothetical protein [Icmadophila ericetorum]